MVMRLFGSLWRGHQSVDSWRLLPLLQSLHLHQIRKTHPFQAFSSSPCLCVHPSRMALSSRKKRRERLENKLEQLAVDPKNVLRVAIDCSVKKFYAMNNKELLHLARQVKESYIASLKSSVACQLHLTGLEKGGDLDALLKEQVPGYANGEQLLMEIKTDLVHEVFEKKDIIYLSPNSRVALQEVDKSRVYVVGGVVDSINTKGLSEKAARSMNVSTARLPIKEYMRPEPQVGAGDINNLPIDQVVGMILSVYSDGDWTKAFQSHLPKRKNWVPIVQQ